MRILGLAMLGGLVALQARAPLPLRVLQLKVFDFYQFMQPRKVAAFPAVIVDIDEASLAELGQWPWPRDLLSDMVRRIFKAGAAAVAFDIVFAEADRLSPPQLAEDMIGLDEELRDTLRRMPDHDALLAATFRATRVVAAEPASMTELRDQPAPLRKASFAFASVPMYRVMGTSFGGLGGDSRQSLPDLARQSLPHFKSLIRNIPVLEQAARGLGTSTLVPGFDGIVRHIPSMIVVDDVIRPSLVLELLRVATGQTTYFIETDHAGIRYIVIAGVKIPTDRRGRFWVHFSPHDPRRFVSAKDVISGNVPRQRLAGKLVFVGASAVGLHDIESTPLIEKMPGVEIQAQLIETIVAGRHLLRPNWAFAAEMAVTVVLGLVVILIIPFLGAVWTVLVGGAIAFVAIRVAWYYYVERLLLIDLSYAMISSIVIYASLFYLNYFREERLREKVRKSFSTVLSPALVERMIKLDQIPTQGGEIRTVTVWISDLENYTTISELLPPTELVDFLNAVYSVMSDTIDEHEGCIPQFVGDAVVAAFNGILEDPDHARHGVEAAIACCARVAKLRETLELPPGFNLRIRIGISTGSLLVGYIGSKRHLSYSVVGDDINLASRLEGVNKVYGSTVLVNGVTKDLCGPDLAFREIDIVRVKGRDTPVRIFEPLGKSADIDQEEERRLQVFAGALAAFRQRRFEAAAAAFDSLAESDPVSVRFAERARDMAADPPPADWDGVNNLLTK